MIKTNSIAVAAACFAILIPSAASAQIKKVGGSYLLRLKFKAGTVKKYNLVTAITGLPASAMGGSGGPMKLTGTLTEKVISVAGNKGTLQVETSAMALATGQTFGQPQTQTVTIDDLGNDGGAGNAPGYGVHLPQKAVKVGESWTQSMAMPGAMGSGQGGATATYKFNGIKSVGGKSLADISFAISSNGLLKGGSGHAYLLPVDGSLSQMDMKMSVSNPSGGADLVTIVSIRPAK